MLRSHAWLLGVLAVTASVGFGCYSGPEQCKRDPITGSERCQTTGGDYGGAAVTAGTATGAWAAFGCTVNGCEAPYACNTKSKQCEPMQCKSNIDCHGYLCDGSTGRCR